MANLKGPMAMDISSLHVTTQMYYGPGFWMSKRDVISKLPSQASPENYPAGMIPGQRFDVWVQYPNLLRITEVPGAIERAILFIGVPSELYISDGNMQYEYETVTARPDMSSAPRSFEELATQHGLPELLKLQHLLSVPFLESLEQTDDKGERECWIDADEQSYCLRLADTGSLPSRMLVYRRTDKEQPIVQFDYSAWGTNVAIPVDTFNVSVA
jgi:hypothetical protein